MFCALETIDNGTLVHFHAASEREKVSQRRIGVLRAGIEKSVREELGAPEYEAPPFVLTQRSVFCKNQEEVTEAISKAISAVGEINELRKAGKLDPMEYGAYLGA